MKRIIVTLIFSTYLCGLSKSEDVRLLDLEPNDAQNIIEQQDTSLKYAPKVDSNVPAVRYLGNEPHNVLEDIYLANQYHGQDGLGGYLYGYSVPDIAKTEKKKAGGDLRGSYNYIAGNGQEIKVEYWDDGTGFHQVDNVPKALPEDLPEVKKAKEEHLRLWHELAERNSHPVESPYNNEGQYKDGPLSVQAQQQAKQQYYNQQNNQQGVYNQPKPYQTVQYQTGASNLQGQYQPAQQYQPNQQKPSYQQTQYQPSQQKPSYPQSQGQYQPNQQSPSYSQPQSQNQPGSYQPQKQYQDKTEGYQQKQNQAYPQYQGSNVQYLGQSSQNTNAYAARPNYPQQHPGQQNQGQEDDGQYNPAQDSEGQYDEAQDENTGPTKGFFYKFDYPVGIIVQKQGSASQVKSN